MKGVIMIAHDIHSNQSLEALKEQEEFFLLSFDFGVKSDLDMLSQDSLF